MGSVTLLAEVLIAATTLFAPLSPGRPAPKPAGHAKAHTAHRAAHQTAPRPAAKAQRWPAKAQHSSTKPARHHASARKAAPPTPRRRQRASRQAAATKATPSSHKRIYTVLATSYQAVASQTDSKPFTTADNSRIKPHYGSRKRWMALSRDLLKPWGGPFIYGDKVQVRGISPKFDGVYTVHDTMNRRHHHRMDVLTHTSEQIEIRQANVKIQLLERRQVAKL